MLEDISLPQLMFHQLSILSATLNPPQVIKIPADLIKIRDWLISTALKVELLELTPYQQINKLLELHSRIGRQLNQPKFITK